MTKGKIQKPQVKAPTNKPDGQDAKKGKKRVDLSKVGQKAKAGDQKNIVQGKGQKREPVGSSKTLKLQKIAKPGTIEAKKAEERKKAAKADNKQSPELTKTLGKKTKDAAQAEGKKESKQIKRQDTKNLQQANRKIVRGNALKMPEFPPPKEERPKPLFLEEKRRKIIRKLVAQRREKELREATPEERILLQHEWEIEDSLQYQYSPADEEVEIYEIDPPYVYVQIIYNKEKYEHFYHVIEPMLTYEEELALEFIKDTLQDVIDILPNELNSDEREKYIKNKFLDVVEDYKMEFGNKEVDITPEESKERVYYYVIRDFIGEGKIDVGFKDTMIEDISCDGPHMPIFIFHRKYAAIKTTIWYRDHDQLDAFIVRLAQRSGKHVSIAEPILEAAAQDGSRIQATLSTEISSFGSTFTIRKFNETPFTPIQLVKFGTMSAQVISYLWLIIENHQSFIYAGGTASGKTTAINALLMFIPPGAKVITIEDTRELKVPVDNWIAGITREGYGPPDENGHQAGEIDMFQLLKNALRQRPEYICVGEVRGAEAYSLFQAMATGHAAYGTMHADSVDAVIHRLEGDPINIPRTLLESLDVVCVQSQTVFQGQRVRRTKEIQEIVGLDGNTGEVLTNKVFEWNPETDEFDFSGITYSLERIALENGKSITEIYAELEFRTKAVQFLSDNDIIDYDRTAKAILLYYKDRPVVEKALEKGEAWV